MTALIDIYNSILNIFPEFIRPVIPFIIAGLLVYSVIQVLKKNFIYLILLVVLLPSSIPVLKTVIDTLIGFLKYLLS